ncbi:Hypothetical predicted protein [Pelobates cultripes]|uniref:Shieldin complex subunit 2 n=1 Tax=Pelobates cultripes TaxID=61616 RepID=A0AAD1T088_PELCU|nr:Hypothetical predicted protein [Pelobates cultripes]
MSKQGAVHVFIGAPVILSHEVDRDEQHASDGDMPKWNELFYINNDNNSCLQTDCQASNTTLKYNELDADIVVKNKSEAQSVERNSDVCASDLLSTSHSFPNFKSEGHKRQHDGRIAALVSSTKQLQVITSPQRTVQNGEIIQDYLDAMFPRRPEHLEEKGVPSENKEVTTTDIEFQTVLTSSQIAHHGHEVISEHGVTCTQTENKSEDTNAEFSEPCNCKEPIAKSDGSLELFTPTSNDSYQAPSSKHLPSNQEDVRELPGLSNLHFGEPSHSYNFKNAASKRPRVFKDMCPSSYSLSGMQQKCKKYKPSSSPNKLHLKISQDTFLKWFDSLVTLKYCSDKAKEYNILAVVVHPCHIKEVKTKPNAGISIPLATIVVLDHSVVERKVVLWRSAAFWTLEVFPGDIIILKHLIVCDNRWNDETVLQSTAKSKFLNLGSCSILCQDSSRIECTVLKDLLDYISTKHHYLSNLPPRKPKNMGSIPYLKIEQLQPETLVHSILKVTDISILTECIYHYKGQKQNKIILAVEQIKGHTGTIVLWGACISWLDWIRPKKDHIWEFRHLFSHRNSVSGDIELHTTPWSSCECLFDDDSRAVDFKKWYLQNKESNTKEMDLLCLLDEKYTGDIVLKASISELLFPMLYHQHISLNMRTPFSHIMVYLPKIIYSGCGKCQKELRTDENHVYEQCLSCLPFNKVTDFYRPAVMTIKNKECEIRVHVSSNILQKIFLNIPPSSLNKAVLCSSTVTYAMVVADLCHSLLAETRESYILKISSRFLLDENSIPLEQEFNLLDFNISI